MRSGKPDERTSSAVKGERIKHKEAAKVLVLS